MAAKRKTAKKALKKKSGVAKKPVAVKKNVKKNTKKTAKKVKKITAATMGKEAASSTRTAAERRRSLRKRRRTIRLQKAGPSLTSVDRVAGSASRQTSHTHTRIIIKRDNIGMLPIDKNVMIKSLVESGSVAALAARFGTTKQAVSAWFGRRGLQAVDVENISGDRKKEVL